MIKYDQHSVSNISAFPRYKGEHLETYSMGNVLIHPGKTIF